MIFGSFNLYFSKYENIGLKIIFLYDQMKISPMTNTNGFEKLEFEEFFVHEFGGILKVLFVADISSREWQTRVLTCHWCIN